MNEGRKIERGVGPGAMDKVEEEMGEKK